MSAILFVKSIIVRCSSPFSSEYSMPFLKAQLLSSSSGFPRFDFFAENVTCSSEEKHTGISLPVRKLILHLLLVQSICCMKIYCMLYPFFDFFTPFIISFLAKLFDCFLKFMCSDWYYFKILLFTTIIISSRKKYSVF